MGRVLVVHRDRSIRWLLIVGADDLEVVGTSDAAVALERLGAERFDAVVVDSHLAVGDDEALRQMRAELRARDIPLAVLARERAAASSLEERFPEAGAWLVTPGDIGQSARLMGWVCGNAAGDTVDDLRVDTTGPRGDAETSACCGVDDDYLRWSLIADAVGRLGEETSRVRFAAEAVVHAVSWGKVHWLPGAHPHLEDAVERFQATVVRDTAVIEHAAAEMDLPYAGLGRSLHYWPALAPVPLDYILSEHAAALAEHAGAIRRARADLRAAVGLASRTEPHKDAGGLDARALTWEAAFRGIAELTDTLPMEALHDLEGSWAGDGAAVLLRPDPQTPPVRAATGPIVGFPTREARIRRELGPAVHGGAISVHSQPLVVLATGKRVGAEALARWQHPELGNVDPEEFIPIAEETGLIVPLGLAVLERACQQAAEHMAPDQRISVNVSARQLASPDFPERVSEVLARAGMSARGLCLEITERAFIGERDGTAEVLGDLRRRGVAIALDDFGTGYSHISLLKTLPIDMLKIDRQFIAGVAVDHADAAIIESIIHMADALRVPTVAEGIETEAQWDALTELGCAYGQGFLFARPQPLSP